jgi:hypothetical protein
MARRLRARLPRLPARSTSRNEGRCCTSPPTVVQGSYRSGPRASGVGEPLATAQVGPRGLPGRTGEFRHSCRESGGLASRVSLDDGPPHGPTVPGGSDVPIVWPDDPTGIPAAGEGGPTSAARPAQPSRGHVPRGRAEPARTGRVVR